MPAVHLCVFFEEMSVQIPCLLFNWTAFSCMSSLYILDISPWSEVWMKYFLPLPRLPFILLASFAVCTAPFCLWNNYSLPFFLVVLCFFCPQKLFDLTLLSSFPQTKLVDHLGPFRFGCQFPKLFVFFFNFTILNWFCHTSKWIRHRYTCVPHPEPSSLLPPPKQFNLYLLSTSRRRWPEHRAVILLRSPQVRYCPWSSWKGPSSNRGALPLEKCFHAQYGTSLVSWVQSNVWKQTWL